VTVYKPALAAAAATTLCALRCCRPWALTDNAYASPAGSTTLLSLPCGWAMVVGCWPGDCGPAATNWMLTLGQQTANWDSTSACGRRTVPQEKAWSCSMQTAHAACKSVC
jgi:hypothetical protein